MPLLEMFFGERELDDDRFESLQKNSVEKHQLSFDLDTYTTLICALCQLGSIGLMRR